MPRRPPPEPGPGRPSVWEDDRVEDDLKTALYLGISRRKAALYAGINYETLKARMRSDDAFSAQIGKWESMGIVHHAKRLHEARDALKVRAAEFYLKTHDKDSFTERKEVDHSGQISLAQLSEDALGSYDDADNE